MDDPLLQFEAAVRELRDAAEAGLQLIAKGHPMAPHERKLIEDTARFIREYDEAKAREVLCQACGERHAPCDEACRCPPDANILPGHRR